MDTSPLRLPQTRSSNRVPHRLDMDVSSACLNLWEVSRSALTDRLPIAMGTALLDPKVPYVSLRPIWLEEDRLSLLQRDVASTDLPAHAGLNLILMSQRREELRAIVKSGVRELIRRQSCVVLDCPVYVQSPAGHRTW